MLRRAITGLVLVATLTGCIGHNALARRVLKFNLTAAEGRWTRELLYVGMWIIPVYPLSILADLLVINSIEFWSHENPLNGRGAVVDIPKSEFEKLGLDAIDVARLEHHDATHASLQLVFENGDRVTFDVLRDGDELTLSYRGVEFYRGPLRL